MTSVRLIRSVHSIQSTPNVLLIGIRILHFILSVLVIVVVIALEFWFQIVLMLLLQSMFFKVIKKNRKLELANLNHKRANLEVSNLHQVQSVKKLALSELPLLNPNDLQVQNTESQNYNYIPFSLLLKILSDHTQQVISNFLYSSLKVCFIISNSSFNILIPNVTPVLWQPIIKKNDRIRRTFQ